MVETDIHSTSYRKQWGTPHPGCLIILIDHSGSMDDVFGGDQIGAGKKKMDMVATVVNTVLDDMIRENTVGKDIKDRADVAVLGYNGSQVMSALPAGVGAGDFTSFSQLQNNPLDVETRTKKAMDDTGSLYDDLVFFTTWVKPVADGGTPMCAALKRTRQLAEQWAQQHTDNFPPVVVHITDGESTDGDPSQEFEQLRGVHTTDGALLLFNCHITEKANPKVEFPASEDMLPADDYAKMLYAASSEVPEGAREIFKQATGVELTAGARGYIFNGDANSVRKLLKFGSSVAKQPVVDPDR
jgi:hypothetical protein